MEKLEQPNINIKGPDQDGHMIVKLLFGSSVFIPKHEAVSLAKWILDKYDTDVIC